jgi:hypothetical protein
VLISFPKTHQLATKILTNETLGTFYIQTTKWEYLFSIENEVIINRDLNGTQTTVKTLFSQKTLLLIVQHTAFQTNFCSSFTFISRSCFSFALSFVLCLLLKPMWGTNSSSVISSLQCFHSSQVPQFICSLAIRSLRDLRLCSFYMASPITHKTRQHKGSFRFVFNLLPLQMYGD